MNFLYYNMFLKLGARGNMNYMFITWAFHLNVGT